MAGARDLDLVLLGGGCSNIQILRAFLRRKPDGVNVVLINNRSNSYYAGGVPGVLIGSSDECEIQVSLSKLAAAAGAQFFQASAMDLDLEKNEIVIAPLEELPRSPMGRSHTQLEAALETRRIHFDLLSVNIGSASRNSTNVPGVMEHAIMTRPIHDFVYKLMVFEDGFLKRQPTPQTIRICVVGAGMSGIELVSALQFRFENRSPRIKVEAHVVSSLELEDTLKCNKLASRVRRKFAQRGVITHVGTHVSRVDSNLVHLDNNSTIPYDLLVWCGGVAPPQFIQTIGSKGKLEVNPAGSGFLSVFPTLQTITRPDIFGSGDCVSIRGLPNVPKAGVIAVRQGPIMTANILSSITTLQHLQSVSSNEDDWAAQKLGVLRQLQLKKFKPQRHCLQIINMGHNFAIGSYDNFAFEGKLAWKFKGWLDRKWVCSFPMARIECCGHKGGDPFDFANNSQIDHNDHNDRPDSPYSMVETPL